jgi:hypothetical protein
VSDDDLTADEAAMLISGFKALGTIDARMAALQQTLLAYHEAGVIAHGHYLDVLNDAADAVLAWQQIRASPFGAMFDPRVIPPDQEDGDE